MPRAFTPEQRAAILASLRVPGAKLTAVARAHGVSPSAVKVIRAAAGLAPLPTEGAKLLAAAARDTLLVEARRRRAALMVELLKDAEHLRRQLFAPARVYAFGRNKNGVHGYTDHRIPEPDAKSKQALAISLGITIDKALQLERYDQESTTAAKAAIIELVDTLRTPQPGDDEEPEEASSA